MRKLILTFLIFSIVSNSALADVVFVSKGSSAPFDGYLFPEAKAKEVRDGLVERDGYKLINESLQRSLDLAKKNEEDLNQKFALVTEQNNKLSENLHAEREASSLSRLLWFALGAASTGFLYGVISKTAK